MTSTVARRAPVRSNLRLSCSVRSLGRRDTTALTPTPVVSKSTLRLLVEYFGMSALMVSLLLGPIVLVLAVSR